MAVNKRKRPRRVGEGANKSQVSLGVGVVAAVITCVACVASVASVVGTGVLVLVTAGGEGESSKANQQDVLQNLHGVSS